MQTLFIGFVEDSVDPYMKGIAIRISYLLSTQFRISGNVSNYFKLEEGLRNMKYESKLKYIDEREKNVAEPMNLYQQHKKNLKLYRKSKSHQKEFIVHQKRMEKHVNAIFNTMVDATVRQGKALGLLDLSPMEESEFYGEYFIRYDDAEDKKDEHNKLSDMLQLKLEDDDNEHPTIFVLNYPFFLPEFNYRDDMELNEFSEKGFIQEVLTFPNYNDFSVTDLNTIRFEVNNNLKGFQHAVNEFTALNANPAKAFNYLHNDVVAAAKTLVEDINKVGSVATYNKICVASSQRQLYLGMIPRYIVFKYFEFAKVSQEATITILNELPDEEMHQLVPVLIISINGEEDNDKETNAQEESIPLKKSLSID